MTDGERSQKPKLSCDFYGGGVNVCREARGRSWDFDELIGEPNVSLRHKTPDS